MPYRVSHGKLILLILSMALAYSLAADGYPTSAKVICFVPILLALYFLLSVLPKTFRLEVFTRQQVLMTYLFFYVMVIFIFALVYLALLEAGESFHNINRNDGIKNLLNFFYFSFITATTVGYGDYYPKSGIAKVFTLIEPMMTAVLFTLMITIFTSHKRRKKEEVKAPEEDIRLL